MPPSPVAVDATVVQVVPLLEVWIWYVRPYAASQFRVTLLRLYDWPRSTCSHCGSLNALDQRVPVLPSVALAAAVPAFSADDAVVGRPWDSSVAPGDPPGVPATDISHSE